MTRNSCASYLRHIPQIRQSPRPRDITSRCLTPAIASTPRNPSRKLWRNRPTGALATSAAGRAPARRARLARGSERRSAGPSARLSRVPNFQFARARRPLFSRYSTLRPSSCRRAQRALEPRRARKSPRLRAPPPRGARAAVGVRARLPHFKVRVIVSRRSLDGRSRPAAGPRRQRLAASLRSPLRAERARVQRASRRARPARRGRGVGSRRLAALAAAAEQGSGVVV